MRFCGCLFRKQASRWENLQTMSEQLKFWFQNLILKKRKTLWIYSSSLGVGQNFRQFCLLLFFVITYEPNERNCLQKLSNFSNQSLYMHNIYINDCYLVNWWRYQGKRSFAHWLKIMELLQCPTERIAYTSFWTTYNWPCHGKLTKSANQIIASPSCWVRYGVGECIFEYGCSLKNIDQFRGMSKKVDLPITSTRFDNSR